MEWWNFFAFLLPLLGYAEIHFRYPSLPSFLHQKEPEIIFDLPHRGRTRTSVPLFLFVKDAHIYPMELIETHIKVISGRTNQSAIHKLPINRIIQNKFYSRVIQLPADLFPGHGEYRIMVILYYLNSKGLAHTLVQDNYPGIPHPPFHIYISRDDLPRLENWRWGDLHVHSNYTDDQVEFGAPLEESLLAAQSCGLDFMAITDHSYDLDDENDNVLKQDKDLKKWAAFRREAAEVSRKYPEFMLIPGEEVSVGNHRRRNVHCLILGDDRFFPGQGDSAESLIRRQPSLSLKRLLKMYSEKAVAIAAHPREKPPLSQRLILNRGIWEDGDCHHARLDALQILNDQNDRSLRKGMALWIRLLLSGQKIGIVAGNDAHGNFNCFRQIAIPFLKMVYSRNHLLGQARTAVFTENRSLAGVLKAIRQHQTVISSGPIAIMQIDGITPARIGDTIRYHNQMKLVIRAKSILEYGHWKDMKLYFGNYKQSREIEKSIQITRPQLEFYQDLPFPEPEADYIRLEAFSQKNENRYFCITSPIWFSRE
jgi:hypothetical protein